MSWPSRVPFWTIVGCTLINVLNYFDRGLLPGSNELINEFITETIKTERPDVYFGALQSIFILGLSLFSPLFANLITKHSPFRLMSIGLLIWVVSVCLTPIAISARSYVLLLVLRMWTGIGEASFACIVPPFIIDVCKDESRGRFMAMYFMAIPIGTALGYICSDRLGRLDHGLRWSLPFLMEGVLMVPFVFLFSCCVPSEYRIGTKVAREKHDVQKDEFSLVQQCCVVFTQRVFLLITIAHSVVVGVTAGYGVFGPALLYGLGMYKKEQQNALAIGILVCLGGLIGMPLGGYLIDGRGKEYNALKSSLSKLSLLSSFSVGPAINFPWPARRSIVLIWMGVTCILLFAMVPVCNIAIMMSVPVSHRPFAIAVSNLCYHLIGDGPIVILIGYLKDALAPNCILGSDHLAEDHHDDHRRKISSDLYRNCSPEDVRGLQVRPNRHCELLANMQSWYIQWTMTILSLLLLITLVMYITAYIIESCADNNLSSSRSFANPNKYDRLRTTEEDEMEMTLSNNTSSVE